MSGETEQDVSGWTIDTLHVMLMKVMDERDRRHEQRFDAQEKAVLKAETATEKRFEGVNEFRQALADQTRESPTRIEVDAQYKSLSDQISNAQKSLEDKAASNSARISALEGDMKALSGQSRGVQQQWGYIFAAVGAITAIAAVVIAIILAGGN